MIQKLKEVPTKETSIKVSQQQSKLFYFTTHTAQSTLVEITKIKLEEQDNCRLKPNSRLIAQTAKLLI